MPTVELRVGNSGEASSLQLGADPEARVSSTERPVAEADTVPGDAQGLLFEGDFSPMPSDLGFRGPVACSAAGITYRQLDYWARTGLVVPEVRGATGSGTQRLYSFRDILILKVIKRLIDAGISLQQIRTAIEHLRARGVEDLTQVTLMSDGVSVFECTRDDEVIDLLSGGQGVFGIALGGVWRSIEGTLSELPAERAVEVVEEPAAVQSSDELSRRRRARAAG
jgi:DNA-binding transcriptional MerR regulator